jgi:riboflavin synthase
MFTGIIEEVGVVRAVRSSGTWMRLEIAASKVLDDITMGASIAVDGCCLTAVEWGDGWWAADAVPETLRRSTLGTLRVGDRVNLERPLAAVSRLGGHIVLGHVDATVPLLGATVLDPADAGDGAVELTFGLPAALALYVVDKGSVALNGVSLTVAGIGRDERGRGTFGVALIPHTRSATTLGAKEPGDLVNLELDYVAKLVAKMVQPYRSEDPTVGFGFDAGLTDPLGDRGDLLGLFPGGVA